MHPWGTQQSSQGWYASSHILAEFGGALLFLEGLIKVTLRKCLLPLSKSSFKYFRLVFFAILFIKNSFYVQNDLVFKKNFPNAMPNSLIIGWAMAMKDRKVDVYCLWIIGLVSHWVDPIIIIGQQKKDNVKNWIIWMSLTMNWSFFVGFLWSWQQSFELFNLWFKLVGCFIRS